MNRSMSLVALLALTTLARAEIPELADAGAPPAPPRAATPAPPAPTAAQPAAADSRPGALESAPRDTRRLVFDRDAKGLARDLDAYFSAYPTQRVHASLDRPLYRPGDTVSVRVWSVQTRGMAANGATLQTTLQDPRGNTVQTLGLTADGSFALPADAAGGTWKVSVTGWNGAVVERPFTVANFQPPRVKKTLDFARDGYGPGDPVQATVTLERATGEKLANTTATVRVQTGGVAQDATTVTTDALGRATIDFTLPKDLATPDVILTVQVDDGGVTEAISRPVPVVLDQVNVAFFPEGGDLVAGLPGRVYFESTDADGEPADIAGTVVDDKGVVVAKLESWVDGRGRASFTPKAGRSYTAHVPRAKGADQTFPLPVAAEGGCVLHHFDDLAGTQQAVRVGVTCTDSRDVIVLASQQEQIIDRARIHVDARLQNTVYLRSADPALSGAQGVARVTVLNGDDEPMAERLVYRNKAKRLSVEIRPDRETYAPGDEVKLTVRTKDPDGRAVAADLSLSVVDDTVLSYADDDEHSLMSRVLLQADLPDPIEGSAAWFAPGDADGGLALDLALGTRGWRRFDWSSIEGMGDYGYGVETIAGVAGGEAGGWGDAGLLGAVGYAEDERQMAVRGGPVPMAQPPMAPMAARASSAPDDDAKQRKGSVESTVVRQFAPPPPPAGGGKAENAKEAPIDARDDFRDTVLWAPAVHTGADGVAKLTFTLSDAITGFRARAEGIGEGWIGEADATISSKLPFHVEARLPVELQAGDQLLLPVTLENQRDQAVPVDLQLEVAGLLKKGAIPGGLKLQPGERRTVHVPVTAGLGRGVADLRLTARAGDLTDGVLQHLPVAPKGFPLHFAASGVLEGETVEVVAIGDATEGSITGRVTLFPTSVSQLTEGMEQMVREPGGCFEQTSSTNYPNVVILDLLDKTGRKDAPQVDRQQVLQRGYGLLTGYQVETGGFETFGQGPGKEALSAFGLLEFTDMAKVFPVSPKVIDENVKYLFHQRNGKGGYEISGSSAHGYGTAPPEVLDAYITYALVETGHTNLPEEIDAQSVLAKKSTDPYRLALATMTLLATRPDEGKAAAKRLAGLQDADGSFPGSETSITRSENQNLLVEATALSTMALLRAGDHASVAKAVRWFQDHQQGAGVWGATQGNALALKAIAAASMASAQMDTPSTVVVKVDGRVVGKAKTIPGNFDPLVVEVPGLAQGKHTVTLAMDKGSLPYALEVGWSSEQPQNDAGRRVDLTTKLADADLGVGDNTRLTATLTNRTGEVVPDPIARIGLPAGLEAQTWQLEQLKDHGDIAFFETRPREVTIYWHGIGKGEVHTVALDLVAIVPGTFTGPASQAYPYYDDQARAWAPGLPVTIEP